MYTIGFSTKFYTLWDVNTYEFWDARENCTVERTSYQYMRNLSFDQASAEQKVRDFIPEGMEYKVDLQLRGHSSWFTEKVTSEKKPDPNAAYHFSFGHYKGSDIRTAGTIELQQFESRMAEIAAQIERDGMDNKIPCESREAVRNHYMKDIIWQLERAMRQENTLRRRACARRRLIELGELVRRNWIEKYPLGQTPEEAEDSGAPIKYGEIKRKWMPRKLAEWHNNIGDKKGLFFVDGARIELEVKKLKEKMFDSQYGTVHVVNYITVDGKLVTYKGTTPPKVETNNFAKIKATVKHDRNETFIQRIKQ